MIKTETTILPLICFMAINILYISPAYALSIAIHIPEKYADVQAGERFYFEIEIEYPENLSRKDLKLNYEILKDDELIARSKILKAIEAQASFMDFIVIPEGAEKGLYSININISDYEDLRKSVSTSFNVVSGKFSHIKVYFYILLAAIIIMGLVIIKFREPSK